MASTSAAKRARGPNQHRPWARTPEDGLSVLRLALETSDPVQRRRVEAMFSAGFSIRRALQGDARNRARAYRAAHHERDRDPAAVRSRVGLSREALERAAYAHLDDAPHLRRFVTKALAMHLADSVWSATERHLFRDAAGKTHGLPRRGRWYDFTRLPGRARSHTAARKWETFRLHGSLAGPATTTLSQRCLCGARVAKSLAERVHDCPACGLRGDRDATTAVLGACVVIGERGTPATAYVDEESARGLLYDVRTRAVLRDTIQLSPTHASVQGRQDVPSESTVHSARDGGSVAEKGPTPDATPRSGGVARRNVGTAPYPTPNEPGPRGQTTSDRARMRTNLFTDRVGRFAQLRDSS